MVKKTDYLSKYFTRLNGMIILLTNRFDCKERRIISQNPVAKAILTILNKKRFKGRDPKKFSQGLNHVPATRQGLPAAEPSPFD